MTELAFICGGYHSAQFGEEGREKMKRGEERRKGGREGGPEGGSFKGRQGGMSSGRKQAGKGTGGRIEQLIQGLP